MKKSIIFLLGAIAALSSCNVDELGEDLRKNTSSVADGKVRVSFDVTMPDTGLDTKAFADVPNIQHLYLAVFGEAGWKQEYVEATCEKATANSNDTPSPVYTYSAELSILEEPCTIHFLAFEDDTHSELPFGPEEEVIAEMFTDNANVAYWNFVKIPEGIVYEGSTTNLKASVAGKLSYVPLIRNFSKFTISTSGTSNFTIKKAKIFNVPQKGYVAPYNKTEGGFIENYESRTVDQLEGLGYIGSAPANAPLLVPDNSTINDVVKSMPTGGTSIVDYVYEREVSTVAPACLLVYGTYSGNDYWYRIDLVKSSDASQHYPIFRNFNYNVVISTIKAAGYSTPEGAFNNGSSGDISVDIRYSDLGNLSNGFSQIFVGFTEMTVVAPVGTTPDPISLSYKFIPDITAMTTETPALVNNTRVTVTAGTAGTAGAAFVDESATTWKNQVEAAWNGTSGNKDAQNFSAITIQPTAPGAVRKVQDIIIKGKETFNDKEITIQRNVSIVVINQQTMYLSPIGMVASSTGTDVQFYLSLPIDLPKSMFPLTLYVEAEQGTISPKSGENLTVETGKSLFNDNKPGYQFVRVVNLDEYQAAAADPDHNGYVKLSAPFKFITTCGESSTNIKVSNKYFVDGATSFVVAKGFASVTAGAPIALGTNGSSSFSFSIDSVTPVTISVSNGTVNGEATYTFTPSAAGVQTVTGIRPSTPGKKVSVTISAEGYVPATLELNRNWTIPVNSVSLNLGSNNLGYTGNWNNNTATASVNAKLNGSTMTPIALSGTLTRTQTGTETGTVYFDAPSGDITRTGDNKKRTYTYQITNADTATFDYYWSTSDATTSNDGTLINLDRNNKFTVGNKDKPNSYTIYIRSVHKTSGATSGWSTFEYNSGSHVSPGSDGEYTAEVPTYSYSFSGPSTAKTVEFDTDLNSGAYFDITYGSTTLGRLDISALQ